MPAEKAPELPQAPEHQEKSLGLDPFSPLALACQLRKVAKGTKAKEKAAKGAKTEGKAKAATQEPEASKPTAKLESSDGLSDEALRAAEGLGLAKALQNLAARPEIATGPVIGHWVGVC